MGGSSSLGQGGQQAGMKRHKQLWERICAFENITDAAREAMLGKRGTVAGARFFADWEREVVRLERELREGSYRPGAYHYFQITDPKLRIVAAAPFRDRVVHHALVRVIEPLFEPRFIEDSYACRQGKGTHAGMRRALEFAKRFPWAIKCDIRRYFPSIDHRILRGQIGRVIGDPDALRLIDLILASHVERTETRWPKGGDLFDAEACRSSLAMCLRSWPHSTKSATLLRSSAFSVAGRGLASPLDAFLWTQDARFEGKPGFRFKAKAA